MSVQPRPVDTVTPDFVQVGEPFVEFAPLLPAGTFGPFRSLGIVDTAEFAKVVNLIQLRSSQSGVSVLVREDVQQFDATLNVGLFQHSPENLQLIFASSTLTSVTGGTLTATDDPFNLSGSARDFVDLTNQLLVEPLTSVTPGPIALENVGTGQGGTFGETTGDFALDFKIALIGDVSLYQETLGTVVTDRTGDLVAGTTPMAGQIAIDTGATATSGQITYPAGEAPASGTIIEASYEPTFTFVENTDFTVDPDPGRVRFLSINGATDELRFFQPMEATYDYTAVDRDDITPYTQFVFQGRTRVRLLTDIGINLIWTIPRTSIRITDDAFTFNRDEFQVSQLAIQVLDAGGAAPFGTAQIFPETP